MQHEDTSLVCYDPDCGAIWNCISQMLQTLTTLVKSLMDFFVKTLFFFPTLFKVKIGVFVLLTGGNQELTWFHAQKVPFLKKALHNSSKTEMFLTILIFWWVVCLWASLDIFLHGSLVSFITLSVINYSLYNVTALAQPHQRWMMHFL